jgi:hypothetical protein
MKQGGIREDGGPSRDVALFVEVVVGRVSGVSGTQISGARDVLPMVFRRVSTPSRAGSDMTHDTA